MTPAFSDWIERAKGERIATILHGRSIKLVAGKGNNRAGPCPLCGGDDRFGVDVVRDLFHCRGCGGKGQGSISFVMFLDQCNFLQAVETLTGEPPPQEVERKDKPRARKARGRFECAYPYTDEIGDELYQVLRYVDPKGFSQRRPDPAHAGAWIENLHDVRMVPYRLPDLIEAIANGYPVFILEGEKDADTGAEWGLITTTTAMGTAGKGHWERGAYDEFFKDAHVVLVPDQDQDDKKGRALAQAIGKRLKPIAASVRLLVLPAKDLTAWKEKGGTRELFDALPVSDFIEPNGHDKSKANGSGNGHASDEAQSGFADVWQMPGTSESAPPPPFMSKTDFIKGFHPPDYLIDGVLQRRFIYSMTGQTGHAKTAVALFFAEKIACPDRAAMIGPHAVEKGRVVYFVGENPDDIRMRVIGADSKRDPHEDPLLDRINFIPGVFNISDMQAVIAANIEAVAGADLVIVDTSAAYFFGDEENSNAQVGAHARKLRKLTELPGGPCVLVLCHPTKSVVEADHLVPRGGGAFLAEMDGNLTCWKHDDNLVRVSFNKMRGPGFEPMTFQLERIMTPELIDSKGRWIPTVRATTITASEEEKQENKAEEEEKQVLASYLRKPEGDPSIADIARDLGWTLPNGEPYKTRVARIIERLMKSQKSPLLRKIRNAKYQLTEAGKGLARQYALQSARIEATVHSNNVVELRRGGRDEDDDDVL